MLLNRDSLAETLLNLNEAWFYGKEISRDSRDTISSFISSRTGEKGSYAGLPAPTEIDFQNKEKRLFTGERLQSAAGSAHILGEEALRALIKLNSQTSEAKNAIDHARAGFEQRLKETSERYGGRLIGMYCCGICTVSYIRNLALGTFVDSVERLEASIGELNKFRTGSGRWRRFPFHYTVLALSEIDHPDALEEIRYAAPSLERILKRKTLKNRYETRRKDLAERALGML
jgi:hypothetical protein